MKIESECWKIDSLLSLLSTRTLGHAESASKSAFQRAARCVRPHGPGTRAQPDARATRRVRRSVHSESSLRPDDEPQGSYVGFSVSHCSLLERLAVGGVKRSFRAAHIFSHPGAC